MEKDCERLCQNSGNNGHEAVSWFITGYWYGGIILVSFM